MTAGYKDETPRFDPIWMRTQLLEEMKAAFDAHVPATAIQVGDELEILRVLQGNIEPFSNGEAEFYKHTALGLVHMSCADGAELTQLRISGPLTMWRDYDLRVSLQHLEEFAENNLLNEEQATIDTMLIHMLGRTSFSLAKSERALGHFMRLPILLGESLGPRLSNIV